MSIRQLSRKISFRLALGSCLLFFVCTAAVLTIAYHFFSYSLTQRDHAIIQTQARELSARYSLDGPEKLKKYISSKLSSTAGNPFSVELILPDGRNSFRYVPDILNRFFRKENSVVPVEKTAEGQWFAVELQDDEDQLEVWSSMLPDGTLIRVGKSDEDRNDLLDILQEIFAGGAIFAGIFGVLGSIWYSNRVLSPLRKLSSTMKTIQDGDFAARVSSDKSGDEIDTIVAVFNQMIGRIQILIHGMRNDLDTIAHDFRTPLTTLRAKAELALQDPTPELAQTALLECMDTSNELLTMLSALLDISEAESGAMKLNVEPADVKDILLQVHDLYEPVAEEKSIAMSIEPMPISIALCDQVRFKRVLANLVDNALKYTSPGGRVHIESKRIDDQICITVSDTGCGIATDDIPRIGNRFFRTETSRSFPGVGLGLSVAKSIVDAHGGSFTVESELGFGTKFRVSLPAADL